MNGVFREQKEEALLGPQLFENITGKPISDVQINAERSLASPAVIHKPTNINATA